MRDAVANEQPSVILQKTYGTDVGYNGYGRQSGALYQSQNDAVYRIREVYTPSGNPDRFVVHFAVGQAF